MQTDVLEHLQRVFGLSALRPQQSRAIAAFLDAEDVLVVLPTGFGKSLCFQLPALTLSRRGQGCTLVVSPLIALMNDQVCALAARGVRAHALHSGIPFREQSAVLDDLASADLVYVSPERLESPRVRRSVRSVARVVIDEAHCISEWGHDFRPEYAKLGWLKHELGAPIMALTATATARVREHIVSSLSLREPVRIEAPSLRPNLRFQVALVTEHDTRTEWASALLAERGFGRRKVEGRAIVYAATRKRAETVQRALRKAGIRAGYYHAGRSDKARIRAQEQFQAGTTPVLVATSAFGMGIDLPDVRMVLHVEAPGTLESYVQQAGRAGRDGQPAECWLSFSPADARIHERLRGTNPTPGSVDGFRALEHYAYSEQCRQLLIAAHLESPTGASDGGRCGGCDACADPAEVTRQLERARSVSEKTAQARSLKLDRELAVSLSTSERDAVFAFVDALAKPVGRRFVAHGLRGSRARAVAKKGLTKNPHFGALRGLPEGAIFRALDELLTEGLLVPKGKKYPTLWIAGKPVRTAQPRGVPKRLNGASPLESTLRNFRRSEAKRRRIKPYQVFQNRTLKALCAQRPQDLEALREVWGIGEERVEKYGSRLLELCAS